MTCLDCKATPGGICAPHKLATSFDAPTDDEREIASLKSECSRLIRAVHLRDREIEHLRCGAVAFRILPSGMVAGFVD